MYAVIRAGGKQYRVAPGDVIRVEKMAPTTDEAGARDVQFTEVLAVSGSEGEIGRPQGAAHVNGRVIGEARGDKVLVFHYKRKKQYKKLAGHRQPYTAVRITEIAFDGQTFTAPELPEPKPRKAKPEAAEVETEAAEAPKPAKKAKAKHAAPAAKHAKKASPAKGKGKKK